jgi:hypothetical protein
LGGEGREGGKRVRGEQGVWVRGKMRRWGGTRKGRERSKEEEGMFRAQKHRKHAHTWTDDMSRISFHLHQHSQTSLALTTLPHVLPTYLMSMLMC